MIYLDSSVELAFFWLRIAIRQTRCGPSCRFKQAARMQSLEPDQCASAQALHGDAVRGLIGRIAMIKMVPPVLRRAVEPFPAPVRTLDAIHLAAIEFIRAQGVSVQPHASLEFPSGMNS